MAVCRKFIDADGLHWQVYELSDDARPDGISTGRWLYFFSRGATRSLSVYPDDWASMDWRALEQLCHRAAPPMAREAARRVVEPPRAEA